MATDHRRVFTWFDLLWLAFLGALALLPPREEVHKQLILLAIGVLQIFEGQIVTRLPQRGPSYAVVLKILLAALLISHTGGVSINSSYYPIFYLPVVTAAVYFGPWGTLLWTALASATYCSYLYPALQEYELTPEGYGELAIRILFFFLAAMVVNRFVMESRRQTQRYQSLAEQFAETNLRLERAQADARRSERLAALGQLSAGLAHEIRNPLGIIKGSAEMLTQRVKASEPLAAELAGYISSEVNRVSSLVTRFLDFARPTKLDLTQESLPDIVDRALRAVAANWTGPSVTVERSYEHNLPSVLLDEHFAEQVFVNLVQNAYEAMSDMTTSNASPGAAAAARILRVSIGRASRNNRDGIEVCVSDSGRGISPELREQIFNPFVTTKKTGVGLGLSIVSKIMDEHRGTLELVPSATGATFAAFFPLIASAPTPVTEETAASRS